MPWRPLSRSKSNWNCKYSILRRGQQAWPNKSTWPLSSTLKPNFVSFSPVVGSSRCWSLAKTPTCWDSVIFEIITNNDGKRRNWILYPFANAHGVINDQLKFVINRHLPFNVIQLTRMLALRQRIRTCIIIIIPLLVVFSLSIQPHSPIVELHFFLMETLFLSLKCSLSTGVIWSYPWLEWVLPIIWACYI